MTYIIAEVGGNHDGSLDNALTLVELAKECGADAVKFQTYSAEKLVHKNEVALPQAQKAGYTTQQERFKDLEFSPEEWERILAKCKDVRIDFLTTPFDIESLNQFKNRMKYIKVASGDLTYHRLLRAIAETGKPVILSTGMARMAEIEESAQFFNRSLLTVMHCVSLYPCPDTEANLGVIDDLKEKFPSVGYSDHTIGNLACIAAVSKGCSVIEKHFTLDNTKEFGDHPLSADPYDMEDLVNQVRRLEKMMFHVKPSPLEETNKRKLRRGAYTLKPIKTGHVITEKDIIELRPQLGRKPHRFVGTRALKDYEEGECLV